MSFIETHFYQDPFFKKLFKKWWIILCQHMYMPMNTYAKSQNTSSNKLDCIFALFSNYMSEI